MPPSHFGDTSDQLVATTRPIESSDDLIALLPAGENVCWVRRGEGLVGWGVAARLQVRGVERFARTQRWWAGLCERLTIDDSVSVPGTGPIAFASYSFDPNEASEVVVPSVLVGQRSGQTWVTVIHRVGEEPATIGAHAASAPRLPTSVNWRDGALSAPEWEKIVGRAVERINAGELDKVVLARDIVADVEGHLDKPSWLGWRSATRPAGRSRWPGSSVQRPNSWFGVPVTS